MPESVSVIVPTVGRPEFLRRLLESIAVQTARVSEVIVADGSSSEDTALVASDDDWKRRGLLVKYVAARPPNAVRQRVAAIAQATGEFLLFVDDDVVLARDCVEQMVRSFRQDAEIIGVCADFVNQTWPRPTRLWRLYLRHVLRMKEGAWQGRVVGPLLRFGYNPQPDRAMPIEWLGTSNTMVRRWAYDRVGGFSDFFLHRCTMNEDVDLGLKMARVGRIVYSPSARMSHFHAPEGRVSPADAAEDDLYNRFLIMRRTQQRTQIAAMALAVLYFVIETTSNIGGCVIRMRGNGFTQRFGGRLRALGRIVAWRHHAGGTT